MTEFTSPPVAAKYLLKPGYVYLPEHPTVISTVVGSGAVVCLFDRQLKRGGMGGFWYPAVVKTQTATTLYGNVNVLTLIQLLVSGGSSRKQLQAQILGGAHNPSISPRDIGRENVQAARRVLARQHIRILSEDVGGELGRKIVYTSHTNELVVMKVERLRQSDWYPYDGER